MKLLEDRIAQDAVVKPGNVLKVDSFLNHQMDVSLFNEMGKEFKKLFANEHVTKILTIEASGIGIACITAQYFNVPVVFAKKSKSVNISNDVYAAKVDSFTHKCVNDVVVSKEYLSKDDQVLILDDFLANGCATEGLISLVEQSGAKVVGVGIAVEKGFQKGGQILRKRGVHLESLAIVESMDSDTGKITFREQ